MAIIRLHSELMRGIRMYKDIKNSKDWCLVERINKGWSRDDKYYIETVNNEKLLLRLSDISNYEVKKKEYEIIQLYSTLGFEMSKPIDFGTCDNHQLVYTLLTFVEGEDLESVLPKLSTKQQYELGRKAGIILKKIHQLKVPDDEIPVQTKVPHKLNQIDRYINSQVRVEYDEIALQYIKRHLDKMWKQKPTYLHGDFHPGNLILTPEGTIGVIDFNRWEIGDPYEEFYKLEIFGTECSVPYCIGQIHAYFEDQVPLQFWETLAVYVAHASLYSIAWAEKFGQNDIDKMIERAQIAFDHYDYFKSIIPSWYSLNIAK